MFVPTAPPWYIAKYGYAPATYDIPGDEAGLLYADRMLGVPFFHGIYSQSPIVFGSFPSLHAAWPVLIALHAPYSTWASRLLWVYSLAVWWAAMYLQHHFFIDLIGGAVYVLVAMRTVAFVSDLLPPRLRVYLPNVRGVFHEHVRPSVA